MGRIEREGKSVCMCVLGRGGEEGAGRQQTDPPVADLHSCHCKPTVTCLEMSKKYHRQHVMGALPRLFDILVNAKGKLLFSLL